MLPVRPRRAVLALSALVATSVSAAAQQPPVNMAQKANFDEFTFSYADVWGEGDVAVVGHFFLNSFDLYDVADPGNVSKITTVTTPSPYDDASCQDVKLHDGLVYVGLEFESDAAVLIYDARNPSSPSLLTAVDSGDSSLNNVHNLFYDEGWLYFSDSATNQVGIVDLRGYDPDAAPAAINGLDWNLTSVGGTFVHDVTARNGRLYACGWDGLYVYDVSDLGGTGPSFLGSTTGSSVHSVWPSDDGRFVVVGEERSTGALKLYEVVDNGSSIDLLLRGMHVEPDTDSVSVHNPVMVGNFVYSSWYQSGARVWAIDEDSASWREVASFDTTPLDNTGSFQGCWGVYPLLGADRILASDIEEGFFVLDTDVLSIRAASSALTEVAPDVATGLSVSVTSQGSPLQPGSVELVVAVDGGVPQVIALADQGGGVHTGTIPPVGCGQSLSWHVRAQNQAGATFTDPPGAPATTYEPFVTSGSTVVFEDDFEFDLGWTVSNTSLSTGAWTRTDPIGTDLQPEDDAGPGTFCYITQNGSIGGSDGEADVDGGPTRLTSPAMDLSGGDAVVSWSYWWADNDGNDTFTVEVSNNGGASWTTARVYDAFSDWDRDAVRVSDVVTPSASVRFRFSVEDEPNDSLTEAGLDEFSAELLLCESGDPWTDLGFGLAGGAGEPDLAPTGPLTPGSAGGLDVTGGPPLATAFFVLGLSEITAPFKGGTLVPNPDIVLGNGLDGAGALTLPFVWPLSSPTGFPFWVQFWIQDAGGPVGFSATSAWRADVP